jgi:hypothetical protein
MEDTSKIEPNPYSPYANADPAYRHFVPGFFGMVPESGVLSLTACDLMTVVPEEPLRETNFDDLPEGLCPSCVAMAKDGQAPVLARPQECKECGSLGSQGEWCALCRQKLHAAWWATKGTESRNG